MKKSFYVIVDRQTDASVTTMPTHSLCQSVISCLPPRGGYSVFKVPLKTKLLDFEFEDLLTEEEVIEYYKKIEKPIKPENWYPEVRYSPASNGLRQD